MCEPKAREVDNIAKIRETCRTRSSSTRAVGVVHGWVEQKHLNCYIFKSFYERSSLGNFHVSA